MYGDDIFVGYRGYEHNHTQPLFPFGFGLSYTTFRYANLAVRPDPSVPAGAYTVAFDITNTGLRAGADVAQVYVSEDHPSVPRPPQELKAFARVDLAPGETKHVTVPLTARSFTGTTLPPNPGTPTPEPSLSTSAVAPPTLNSRARSGWRNQFCYRLTEC